SNRARACQRNDDNGKSRSQIKCCLSIESGQSRLSFTKELCPSANIRVRQRKPRARKHAAIFKPIPATEGVDDFRAGVRRGGRRFLWQRRHNYLLRISGRALEERSRGND